MEITVPMAELQRSLQGVGFEQIIPDNITGTVYEYPMFLEYDGYVYPALGMLMAADILGIDLRRCTWNRRCIWKWSHQAGMGTLKPARAQFLSMKNLRMLMNWSAPYFETYFHINFRQLYYVSVQVKPWFVELRALLEEISKLYNGFIDKVPRANIGWRMKKWSLIPVACLAVP